MDQQLDDRHVFLFSSNATTLYAIDALNVVCLPQNWIVHFRYERSYVDPLLWQAAEQPPGIDGRSRLHGRGAIISFVNQRNTTQDAGSQPQVLNIVPLRAGMIEHVSIDGEVIHFYFSLGNYVRYYAATSGEVQELATSRDQLLTDLLVDRAGGPAKSPRNGKFAAFGGVPTTGFITNEGDVVGAFQALVRVLSGRGFDPELTIFSLFHGLFELEQGKPLEVLTKVPVGPGILPFQSGYAVKEGRDYAFLVTTFNTATLNRTYFAEAAIELANDPNRFDKLDRMPVPIRSRYDRFALPFAVRRHKRTAWTAVALEGTPGLDSTGLIQEQGAAPAQFLGPEWVIPVHVTVNWWLANMPPVIAEILVTGGSAATAVLVALEYDLHWIVITIFMTLFGILVRIVFLDRRDYHN